MWWTQLLVAHSNEYKKYVLSEFGWLFTLFAFDVFFDDTDVHFSSSSLFFGRLGGVTTGEFSTIIGGEDLFIVSDSDVRNLESKIVVRFLFHFFHLLILLFSLLLSLLFFHR